MSAPNSVERQVVVNRVAGTVIEGHDANPRALIQLSRVGDSWFSSFAALNEDLTDGRSRPPYPVVVGNIDERHGSIPVSLRQAAYPGLDVLEKRSSKEGERGTGMCDDGAVRETA